METRDSVQFPHQKLAFGTSGHILLKKDIKLYWSCRILLDFLTFYFLPKMLLLVVNIKYFQVNEFTEYTGDLEN